MPAAVLECRVLSVRVVWPQAMVQGEVHLEGHLLVCGCGTPPAALACLLRPLRSSALPGTLQPVVVLDTTKPSGPEWEELARYSHHRCWGILRKLQTLQRAGWCIQ